MRPSHWLLVSFLVFASVVTATGGWMRAISGPEVHRWVAIRGDQAVRAVERGEPVEMFGGIVDRRGFPVAGAAVSVIGTTAKTVSDGLGRFSLVVQGRRSRELTVSAEGFASVRGRVVVPGQARFVVMPDATPWSSEAESGPSGAGSSGAGPSEFGAVADSGEADAQDAQVTVPSPLFGEPSLLFGEGFLVDRDGRRVPFARVAVRETGETVFADERGHFRVPLPSDASDIVLVAGDREGRVARSASFRPSRKQGRMPVEDLVLAPGRMIGGFVRDAEQRVVDGAIVVATDGEIEHVAVTGRAGSFRLEGLCAGADYRLRVLPTRGLVGGHSMVTMRDDLEVDMAIRRVEDRRYRVLQVSDRAPIAEAHVVARWELCETYARADADGWVTMSGVAAVDTTRGVEFEVRDESLEPLAVDHVDDQLILVAED